MSFVSRLKSFLSQEVRHLEEYHSTASTQFDRDLQKASEDIKHFMEDVDHQTKNVAREVSESSLNARARASKAMTEAGEKIKGKTDELARRARELAKDNASGKYLTVNILSRNDEMLATRGEMVTYSLLNKADTEGKLDQVLRNVSRSPIVDEFQIIQKKKAPRRITKLSKE